MGTLEAFGFFYWTKHENVILVLKTSSHFEPLLHFWSVQVCDVKHFHQTCAERERRLQKLHSRIEQQQAQLQRWTRPTAQTLARSALPEWEVSSSQAQRYLSPSLSAELPLIFAVCLPGCCRQSEGGLCSPAGVEDNPSALWEGRKAPVWGCLLRPSRAPQSDV